ncbi:replication factor C subunit 3 [Agrilus planipennis]|uniref:Replication factor C subunit 3 n=1 Tax=Agrilus planipennis TaxID=224129 RepID=A0A1W4WBD7_AGRPL|nr:replication factor C subunit 3 [Agrilus planipennis]XP_018321301.1 replication factor C subunit 3 [Agrilus planipennis]
MSLWADKYRPKDLQKLDYHKEQAANLSKLTQEGDFPHLLFYGPCGSGKKTRMMCLLKEMYGPGVERLKVENMNFTTPSNKKLEVTTVSSSYHIEVNPSDVGIYDRVIIMNLIKNVAQTQQLDINGQRAFKVIVLTNVDELTKDAQHALRRTMEKYISTCRLLLCGTSISRIIPAIRSRCLCIRVAAPSIEQISTILQTICKKEGLTLPLELADRIAIKSNRNLRRALLMCEACKVESYPFTPDQEIEEPDWQIFIKHIANKAIKEQSISTLAEIRERFYELIIHGIPSDIIFKTLLKELLKISDPEIHPQIVESAAFYEHRLQTGSKDIFHLEAFMAKFMCIYSQFLGEFVDIC